MSNNADTNQDETQNAKESDQSRSISQPWKVGTLFVSFMILSIAFLGWWWNTEPQSFDVQEKAYLASSARGHQLVTGYLTTTALIEIANTLLTKRGGYLSNDIFPPGLFMDNIPEWEFGVLTLLRDSARVYRNDFSRSQSQSAEDPDLSLAESKFFFDNNSWMLPATESEYREGIDFFESYRDRLANPSEANAQFYSRSDNLRQWLAAMETRLGSLSQRLSASTGKKQLNTDLAGDQAATRSTNQPGDQIVKTPWLEIDNIFYESRGFCWALIQFLRAIEADFAAVLDKKNARISLKQIVRELEPTQKTLWSPMVLNGDGFGPLANHSLVMASHISRANAAIIDLRNLLAEG